MTHLRQDRLPREAKMARERSLLEGAHEVRYSELAFRPRHPASLEEVRDAVDALVVRKLALPEPAPPPAPPEPEAPSIDPAKREALAPVVPGVLVAVETCYRVSEGEVVEATSEEGGARRKGLYLLSGGSARPFDDVEARIDALPEPRRPAPVEEAPTAPALPAAAPAPEEPKRKAFGLRRGKEKASDAAPPPETPAEEKPAKPGFASRFRVGKGKEAAPEPPAPETPPAPAEEASGDAAKPAKRRFPFRK